MLVDPRPRAGVAEGQHRGVVVLAEISGQRAHRTAPLPETVEEDHRRACDGGNLSGGCERIKLLPAGIGRAGKDDAIGRIQNARRVTPRPPLDPPFVPHKFVRPLHRLGGAAQPLTPVVGGDRRLGFDARFIGRGTGRCGERDKRSEDYGPGVRQPAAIRGSWGVCSHRQPSLRQRSSGFCPPGHRAHRNSLQPRFSSSATTRRTASSCDRAATSVASGVCTTSISARPIVTTR